MREEVVRLATEAGELLLESYGELRRADAAHKGGNRRDLVSAADVASERFLLERIPDRDDVLSEEGSSRDRGATRKWVIDPLDGTVNFLHGIPFWAVSIGLLEEGELIAAAVRAPALDQTFSAARGGGAFLGADRIEVSNTAELGDAILATGFAYQRDRVADNNLDNFATLALEAAGLRRMGAAAVDLCYVASGRLDGFWELHLHPWDLAAGTLIVREAGGRVSDFHGAEEAEAVLHHRHIVASNGLLHEPIRARLAPLKGL